MNFKQQESKLPPQGPEPPGYPVQSPTGPSIASQTSVQISLKKNKFYPYKIHLLQELNDNDYNKEEYLGLRKR